MDRGFDAWLGRYLNPESQQRLKRRIEWLCGHCAGSVLDVGCSQGLTPFLLAQRGLKVVGVDIDSEAIACAENFIADLPASAAANVVLVNQDFKEFNPGVEFDTIVASEYLEHLDDANLHAHLAKIRSLLNSGGRAVFTVPFGPHPHPDHLQTFFPTSFASLLNQYFPDFKIWVADGFIRCVASLREPGSQTGLKEQLELLAEGVEELAALNHPWAKIEEPDRAEEVSGSGSAPAVAETCKASVSGDMPPQKKKVGIEKRPAAERVQPDHIPTDAITAADLASALAHRGLTPPYAYNLELFSALNEIYGERRPHKEDKEKKSFSETDQHEKRLAALTLLLPDLPGLKVLEVGCGKGRLASLLEAKTGCGVYGVDQRACPDWSGYAEGVVKSADLQTQKIFNSNSFDFAYSFLFLHLAKDPMAVLKSVYDLLKPGGKFFFTVNLQRGSRASNRYREIYFPWPHLLFEDAVFENYYRAKKLKGSGKPAPINKYTNLHYLDLAQKAGFLILDVKYSKSHLDLEFYNCFIDVLGKYPKEDLELDFMNILASKPEMQ